MTSIFAPTAIMRETWKGCLNPTSHQTLLLPEPRPIPENIAAEDELPHSCRRRRRSKILLCDRCLSQIEFNSVKFYRKCFSTLLITLITLITYIIGYEWDENYDICAVCFWYEELRCRDAESVRSIGDDRIESNERSGGRKRGMLSMTYNWTLTFFSFIRPEKWKDRPSVMLKDLRSSNFSRTNLLVQ